MSRIEITQIRSAAGQNPKVASVLRGLGLKKIGHTKVHNDNNCIRGMVNKVRHLVRYKLEQ